MSSFDVAYRLVYTDSFLKDQRRFVKDQQLLADLCLTVGEISRQPFKNPQLETHRVRGAQAGIMTSYVGNQQHRVIWFKANQTAFLLLFDRHDEAYRRAVGRRVGLDGEDGVRVVELQAADPRESTADARATHATPGPFDPWDDLLLAVAGFAPHEINLLREARDDDGVLALQRYLAPASFELALQVALAASEDEVRVLAAPVAAPEELAPDETLFAEQVEERVLAGAGGSVALLDASDIESVLTRPIEDWMVFLHPDQRRLVDRRFNGPARITGGAGTGKTVVGVHRAARLAADGRKVLFTTYIRTLPKVFETLYRRLAPDTADRVTFSGIHSHALSIARTTGIRLQADQIDAAFEDAWKVTAVPGNRLRQMGLGPQYVRNEIAWIIKGRGLTVADRASYLAAPRTGRGTPFSQDVREQIWEMFVLYERRLRAHNTVDFDDVIRIARDRVRAHGDLGAYDAVIVDEAQDLTRVGLEFVAAIVGDREDGLLLLGDGQQSLYPGGHSLRSVGIDVRGRAAVLRLNYRNTREILLAADRIVAGRPFDDGDDELQQAGPSPRIDVARRGPEPLVRSFATEDDHDEALTLAISDLSSRSDTDLGDIAVLVPNNRLVRDYAASIAGLGLACRTLDKYDGTPSSEVKVGTFKRAKGLEFKHVLLPRAEPGKLYDAPFRGEDGPTHQERLDRTRRELFVAMTRARDTVWVGHVGEPSRLLGAP
jgi:superfamily I DNA/RNA helicase